MKFYQKCFVFICINTSLNNTKIPEVITAKCFHKCHNNNQFIPRVYMFIKHKMTHRYIYFRFTRHALLLHHVTMLNYLHGYKRLCCPNLAYRQTENKWSFFVEHLNSWFAGTHEIGIPRIKINSQYLMNLVVRLSLKTLLYLY